MRRFKDLAVGETFKFSDWKERLGEITGPWRKVSARCYEYYDKPNKKYKHEVGSINVEVTTAED